MVTLSDKTSPATSHNKSQAVRKVTGHGTRVGARCSGHLAAGGLAQALRHYQLVALACTGSKPRIYESKWLTSC
ncbi:hypothetical protein R5R35_010028 [Gryllus longicercus]|uniref:Uncharacterized protein n=1 Tax=Gryllus longicercus TaxID=2509291 RepID=A0AAN9W5P6_9ORTH